jgi:hypothetical protein
MKKQELLQSLLHLGLAGAGIGAGIRAGTGLHQLLIAGKPKPATTLPTPDTVPVPVLRPDPTEMSEPDDGVEGEPSIAKMAEKLAAEQWLPQPIADAMPNLSNSGHPFASWQGMPAAVGVGTLGVAGGYSLMDWLAKHRRKAEQKADVDDARDEFRSALANEYNTAMSAKQANELDAAFDEWQKQANGRQQLADIGNLAGGMYGAAALALGGGTAYMTYKAMKERSAQKLLQKAIAARARQRSTPQPIYAVPTNDLATV